MWCHQSWHGHPVLWIHSYMLAVTASTEPPTANFCAVCTLKIIEIWFIKRPPQVGEVALHIPIRVQGRPSLQKRSNTMQPWTKSVLGRPMALNEVTLEVCSKCNGIYNDWLQGPAILLSQGHLHMKFKTAIQLKARTQLHLNLDTLRDQECQKPDQSAHICLRCDNNFELSHSIPTRFITTYCHWHYSTSS